MQPSEAPKRAHPRYTVSSLSGMKARMDRSSSAEQIVTIGAGGCGFVGFGPTWKDNDIKRVISVFELNLSEKIGPIRIQGNIVYIKPVTVAGRPMYYLGIEFLPEDAHRIRPMIEALHELSKKGEVAVASA